MAKIQLEYSAVTDFFVEPHGLSRQEVIAVRKQAIYQYRNQLLGQRLNRSVENSDFSKSAFGKPFLPDFPSFHFNHSHSQQHYVLASSEKIASIGVDIEDLNRKVRFDAMAQHSFHPEELLHWEGCEHDPDFWFKVWTTKEAVLKASGLGIRVNLNELNTQCHPEQNGGMCSHPAIGTFAYQNIQLPHVMLTVAWQSEQSCRGFHLPKIELNVL
ncbi:4'-phosphopantetheinyl transferase superfamily protein [Acinetobacter sp. ANC 4945]|uniref:ACP synthase n=1 Tax=Acinetobacter amyesii TaxID=2942470 RepID=A0A1T1H3J6_9GAMM|nr:4'-phosphopantetheinyl transferase superfamily protein [Acinetobacter amyesii]MCL6247597.1 4'-phosphopantetheinyl transferase superfamily protein [Acinetobacter amyesii]OOV84449.1 ACP synthase [Acinetobacter amyesii]